MSDWQKIETAPQDGTKVLILCADGEVYAARWDETFDFIFDEGRDEPEYQGHHRGAWTDWAVKSFGYEEVMEYEPTHWMPLPPPPETRDD